MWVSTCAFSWLRAIAFSLSPRKGGANRPLPLSPSRWLLSPLALLSPAPPWPRPRRPAPPWLAPPCAWWLPRPRPYVPTLPRSHRTQPVQGGAVGRRWWAQVVHSALPWRSRSVGPHCVRADGLAEANAEPNDARLHGVCSAGPQRPRKRGGTPAIVSPLIMATRVCTVHPHTPPSRPRRGGFGYASQLSVDVGPSGWMSLRWVNTPSALYFRRHPTPIPRLRPTRRPWAPLQSNRHRGVCGADAGHASGRMIPILTNWTITARPTTADGSRGSGGTPQGGLRAHSFDLVRACAKARHALCRTSIRIRSSSTARPSRGDRHQRNAFCCIRLRVTTRSW